VVTPPALGEAVGRITGRDRVARADPDWIPDHERRARRRRSWAVARRRALGPPPILWIRVLPVEPKRLTANNG
jgi:hypothetical protein